MHVPSASKGGHDWSTLPPRAATDAGGGLAGAETAALCVLWSRDEPERMGEVLVLPPGKPGPWTFGRGDAPDDGGRLSLARQVPGALVRRAPLACPRISRTQLRITHAPGGGVLVENVGSCPLVYRGRDTERVELAAGDTFALRNEILFLCVRRGASWPPSELGLPLHPLGAPDAFGIVGESPTVWELRHRLLAVARQPFHVLVVGESGSGKELVAQAIHARSTRGARPMVSRNAATIPEGLADAELFGNVRGYPNPGMPERPGLVGEAHGSTLFLDEFAELAPSLQAHLLRVLDGGEYQRLGEATTRKSDLRVIAATNRSSSDIKHDVLARLKVHIPVPDLNVRREDIPLLVVHLMRRHAEGEGVARRFFPGGDPQAMPLVSPVLMEALVHHRYTTHVRELDALLVRAALEGRGKYLELGPELKAHLRASAAAASSKPGGAGVAGFTPEENLRLALLRKHRFSPTACGRDAAYPGNRQTADLHLRQLVCRALALAGWSPRAAAELLAGPDSADLEEKCAARIATFLANLRARIANEPPEALRDALLEEWKGSADGVRLVVDALRAGTIEDA